MKRIGVCFLLLIALLYYNKREPNWIGLLPPSSFLFKREIGKLVRNDGEGRREGFV